MPALLSARSDSASFPQEEELGAAEPSIARVESATEDLVETKSAPPSIDGGGEAREGRRISSGGDWEAGEGLSLPKQRAAREGEGPCASDGRQWGGRRRCLYLDRKSVV